MQTAPVFAADISVMITAMTADTTNALTEEEFKAAERMLAGLLADATTEEAAMILTLHARIERLFEQGAEERRSRLRLRDLCRDLNCEGSSGKGQSHHVR